jgi:hypothetical protein
LKEKKLPIFIILNNNIDKKYFEYFLYINNYNSFLEFFILEFFLFLYLDVQNNKNYINKNNYLILNRLNILKKND